MEEKRARSGATSSNGKKRWKINKIRPSPPSRNIL